MNRVFFTWDIDYRCNYNCTYCFLHYEPETTNIKTVYLEPQEWIKIWKDIYERYGYCHISVTGGEPFIYPNFIDIISELSQIHTFEFSTNLSWDIKDFVKKISPERVIINSSFHPEFIGIQKFLERFFFLKQNNYPISITIVAYPPLLEKIIEYKELFEKNGLKAIIYPYRGPYWSRKYPEGYTQTEKRFLRQLEIRVGAKVTGKLIDAHICGKGEETPGGRKLCHMGQRYAKIVPNGDAYRCCAAVNKDWGRLGNIINNTFSLLKKPEYCPDYRNCSCYKAMIVTEEKKWLKHWKVPYSIIKEQKVDAEIEKAKNPRDEEKIDETINKLNKILTESTKPVKAVRLLDKICTAQRDFTEVERTLQIALEKNANGDYNPWIYRALSKLYCDSALYSDKFIEKKQRFSYALIYLLKAIESTGESSSLIDKAWIYYEMAFVYFSQETYELAKENINIALKYQPENEHFRDLLEEIEAVI